jgi:hypothetical protein
LAKGAGLKSSVSISREAKLIRVIRVDLVKQKLKRVAVEKRPEAIVEKGRLVENPIGLFEKGRVNGNPTRAERIGDPIVAKAKRTADPAEAVTGGQPARRAE